jgi:quinoprotein glucose dehydrogenase
MATGAGALVAARISVPAYAAQSAGMGWAYNTNNGQWGTYGGDLRSNRYSALDQISGGNFNRLQLAWRFKPNNLGPTPEVNLQTTPLVVNGVMYTTAGSRRAAVALDPTTGEMLWKYNLNEGARRGPRVQSGRGLAYWTDGREERIIYVTPGYQMIALHAKTGLPVESFGVNGVVDLRKNLPDGQNVDMNNADIGYAAAPMVVNDVIVMGSAHRPSPRPMRSYIKGAVRGYDARTGKYLWIFHTIPQKGEFGADTWLDNSNERVGNGGSWAQMSADPDLGLVYVGIELPSGDWYGAARPGAGLFGESVVALDIKTGKRRWHYQTVHHGLQDRDIASAAILADITVDGRKIKALAQLVKHSWVFVLDRENGQPVWPIPELPVPKGDVPGEWYSPTQPHPSKPPAFDRQGISVDDLIDFTPELRAEAVRKIADYRIGPVFTPPTWSKWPRPLATITVPMSDGSAQWPGGALDPETNVLYVFSNLAYGAVGIVPGDPALTDNAGMQGIASPPPGSPPVPRGNQLAIQGLPLIKPPYGRITAIDLNKGDFVWQKPHGETPDEVRNHPALKGLDIPRTGSLGKVGVLVTKTLVIAGDGTATTAPDGELTGWLRAYDKATGQELGAVRIPGRVTGSPMTYSIDGKQYISVAVALPGQPAELVTYRLPG